MTVLSVESLTLKELVVILSAKFNLELVSADEFLKEWNAAMGTSDGLSQSEKKVKQLMVDHLCRIIAERIVYADNSPIEYEDFVHLEPKLLAVLVEDTDIDEDLFLNSDLHKIYLKTLFLTICKAIGLMEEYSLESFKVWIQAYLNLSRIESVGETLVIEPALIDAIIRGSQTREVYFRNGVTDIYRMTDVELFIQTMILPIVSKTFENVVMSESEKESQIRLAVENMAVALSSRLELARKLLLKRLEKRTTEIYG